jgi:hypothetical protein
MKTALSIVVAGGMLCSGAFAAELAYTVRPTEMKAKPFTDAATLASLAEASKVDVMTRQASWIQVKSDKNTGWVKMLSLRFNALDANAKPGATNSNLAVMFNIATTGSGGSTPTTGVKGISEEALKNPSPNPAALKQVQDMQVSKAEMEAFVKAGKLARKDMDYLPAVVAANTQGEKK